MSTKGLTVERAELPEVELARHDTSAELLAPGRRGAATRATTRATPAMAPPALTTEIAAPLERFPTHPAMRLCWVASGTSTKARIEASSIVVDTVRPWLVPSAATKTNRPNDGMVDSSAARMRKAA